MKRSKPDAGVVASCVQRQDGKYMIVTKDRKSGVSDEPRPVGQHIKIVEGRVQ